jgi:hypothetical protein
MLDLSNLGSGEKDLASAKAVRPTERARRSQPRGEKGDAADEVKELRKFGQIFRSGITGTHISILALPSPAETMNGSADGRFERYRLYFSFSHWPPRKLHSHNDALNNRHYVFMEVFRKLLVGNMLIYGHCESDI